MKFQELKLQFEIPWFDFSTRPLPIAVTEDEGRIADPSMVEAKVFQAEASDTGLLLVNFPLALFLRSLMSAAPEVRGFVLDTIGKTEAGKVRPELVAHLLDAIGAEACKLHFGLVGLNEPKGALPSVVVAQRVRIRDGWADAGREGVRLGPDVMIDQVWAPVLWDDEDDPDFHKSAGLVELRQPEEPKPTCETCAKTIALYGYTLCPLHLGTKEARP